MNAPGAVLAAGLAALAVAAAVDLIGGARWPRLRAVPYLAGAAGAGCLAVAGAAAVAGHQARLGTGGWLGTGTAGLAADRLSGLFLLIAFAAAVPVSLACASWAARPRTVGRRGLGAGSALTLGSVALVLTAADAFTLLLAWELLTVAFYLLAGFERRRPGRPGAAVVTLVFGKISGAALLVGLLLLAVRSGSLELASFARVPGGVARNTAQTLLIAGFAIKVGLIPVQVWMPRGYAAAPGPVRAIMAGVAVNVGFYGLWRTLALLGAPPAWLAGLLLVLAGLTALLGIAHAAVQPRLQRVIAYSSVENSGLILAGYGVALTGVATRDARLVAAGLLAATLQIIAHTAAKSLLFTTSAVIAPDGTRAASPEDDNLDGLRGSARRLPWSGTGLAIGSLTLAGLPLTAGFAAEWFLLEALMQQFRVPGLGFRLVLAVAGAAIALTIGFAGVTFVRLTGLVVLGPPPARPGSAEPGSAEPGSAEPGPAEPGPAEPGPAEPGPAEPGPAEPGPAEPGRAREQDYGWLGRAAILILSLGCLATAALLPLVIRVVAAGLAPVVPAAVTSGALKSPWVVQPVFSGFSILSPSWLWVAMPLLALGVLAFTWLAGGTRMTRVRRVPAWRSATAGVEGADCYTAAGFANPTRRVLATVLHTQSELRPLSPAPGGSSAEPDEVSPAPGPDEADRELVAAQAGPGTATMPRPGPRFGYTTDVVEVVETYLYRPALRPVMALVRAAKRMQSGRLDAYLTYMLIALVALLALVAVLA